MAADEKVKKRLVDIQANPAIGKTEQELDEYLKKRGVKIQKYFNSVAEELLDNKDDEIGDTL